MAAPTQADIDRLQGQIDELNGRLKEMDDKLKSVDKTSGSISKKIGDSTNFLKDAVISVQQINKDFIAFAQNTQKQYEMGEKLAMVSKQTAISMGLSVGRSGEFSKNFNRASAHKTSKNNNGITVNKPLVARVFKR
jgi:septal ring factor EnvC (AmiA/AmiB activator)